MVASATSDAKKGFPFFFILEENNPLPIPLTIKVPKERGPSIYVGLLDMFAIAADKRESKMIAKIEKPTINDL